MPDPDIIALLDDCMWCRWGDHPDGPHCPVHGDLVTIERLRAALRPLADIADRIDGVPPQPHYPDDMDVATVLASAHRVTLGQARVARRVLEGEG